MILTRSKLRPRRIKPRPRQPQDDLWKGHDDHFAGPVPPVDHWKSMCGTARLSRVCWRFHLRGIVMVQHEKVIAALKSAGVRFVLMGAHATNGWTRVDRATRDVDVLIQKSHHRKAVQVIRAAFPDLTPEEHPVVTRFRDPADGVAAIDLMKPADAIHRAVWRNCVPVGRSHLVPNLEMTLACKFAAMTSLNRPREKRLQDAADFGLVVKHNRKDINRQRLQQLGEVVYSRGGVDVLRLVDDFLADRPIVI